MNIPLMMQLARERVESFHRSVKLFQTCRNLDLEDLFALCSLVKGFVLTRQDPWPIQNVSMLPEEPFFHLAIPTFLSCALDQAILWANTKPLPSIRDLRQTRADIEALLEAWSEAWTLLPKVVRHRDQQILNIATLAMAEHRRMIQAIEEGWPVDSKEQEEQSLAEILAGDFLELDDAFGQIAEVGKEDWLRKVEEHKKNTHP